MQIRVVLVSPVPLADAVVALLPDGDTHLSSATAYGHVTSILCDHGDPDSLRGLLREAAGPAVAVGVITGPLATAPAGLILLDVDSTFTTTEAVDL
ncbi:MAG: hypothetical protein ABIS84_05245, partial [Arachnia sp.]